jgi:hypothetical protein
VVLLVLGLLPRSAMDATVDYVLHQKEHHQKRGFGEELAKILARHGMS